MKEYLKQFYNEGFATTFYRKPLNYLTKKIKNKKIVMILSYVLKIIYTLLVLLFAGYMLYTKLK